MNLIFFNILLVSLVCLHASENSLGLAHDQECPYTLKTLDEHIRDSQRARTECHIAFCNNNMSNWYDPEDLAHDILIQKDLPKEPLTRAPIEHVATYRVDDGDANAIKRLNTHNDEAGVLTYAINNAPMRAFEKYFIDFKSVVPTQDKFSWLMPVLNRNGKSTDPKISSRALVLSGIIKSRIHFINRTCGDVYTLSYMEKMKREAISELKQVTEMGDEVVGAPLYTIARSQHVSIDPAYDLAATIREFRPQR